MIEKTLTDLTQAVLTLVSQMDDLRAYLPPPPKTTATAPDAATPKTKTKAKTKAKTEAKSDAVDRSVATIDDAREAVLGVAQSINREAAAALVDKFGAAKLGDLNAACYSELIAEAKQMMDNANQN
jgi:hypothetical protein